MKMKPLLDECLALKLRFQGITSTDLNTSIDSVARAVQSEKPDLRTHAAPDGTVTLMFSDIEDSTVLTESLGDQAWQELLRKHNAPHPRADPRVRRLRSEDDGRRVHGRLSVGEEGAGVRGGDPARVRLAQCGRRRARAVRIGLHAGEAIKEGDDFYGKNVIMASRVAGKANGGEILVSSLLRSLVESSVDGAMFSEAREVELKGLSGTHAVYDIAWQATAQA